MRKSEVTKNDVIHCETVEEFYRILELFEIDTEYMMWSVYEKDTVLFPFDKQYGAIDGYCQEENMAVIKSIDVL